MSQFLDLLPIHCIVRLMRLAGTLLLVLTGMIQASLLDSDPKVVYTTEFAPEGMELKVSKAMMVFGTKDAKQKRGRLKLGSKVELVGFDERAFQVRGTRSNGEGVSGWVSPKAFASENPNLVDDFKQIYRRQLIVRDLIAHKEVAVGMTEHEVAQSLGEPTKTNARLTANGSTGTWEFIVYETVKHYANVRDPYTGGIYRQLVNTTKEEKSKVAVEFENGIATAVEESEDRTGRKGRVRSVAYPILLTW